MSAILGSTIEDVLEHFDFRASKKDFKPYFVLKSAGTIHWTNREDDITSARESLENSLKAFKTKGSTAVISIIFYRKLDKNEEPTGTGETFTVRLNEVNQYGQGLPMMNPSITALEQKIDILSGKLAELSDEEEEEEEEGWLSGITKEPEFKNYIMKMFFSQMGLQNNSYQQPTTLNGVENPEEEKEKIRTALQLLSKHTKSLGDDLMKLATMSETDTNQFQFLLTMLRK